MFYRTHFYDKIKLMVEKHYWRGVMTKRSGITVIIGTWLLFNTHTAQAQLPTVDFGNLAGTIGIVTQGITNVQQGIEVITNGSNLNAIIGDAVGTISKFASTIKGYVQDAQQAIEKAKQRIAEGKELYNKYKNEIEERKNKYQQLLASIPNYTNPNSYDDSSSSGSSSGGSSNGNSSYGGSSNSNSTYGGSSSGNSSYQGSSNNNGNGSILPANPGRPITPSNTGGQNTSGYNTNGGTDDSTYINNNEPEIVDNESPLPEEESLFDEEEQEESEDTQAQKTDSDQGNETTVSLGRKAFGAPGSSKEEPENAEENVKGTTEETTNDTEEAQESSSKDAEELKAPSVGTSEGKFRVSPSSDLGRRSHNTITFSSRMAFAAETSNSNKGTGYDKNGVFIFNTKYCDKSVDDMLTEQGTRECLVNIINKINDKNSYYAANSQEDCKKMVFETAVALLAEATSIKSEASNYQDTLDEQETLGGNSNNTRDDTQVLAMNYEQTQKLLNKLTTLLSGETIFSIAKEICGASEKVLEPDEVDIDNGGK